ncbi:MAG: DUF5662 family protein [Phycisphaerae bacterium]|nr:DUF5662 family protein [Phycisphaerae bacterium]
MNTKKEYFYKETGKHIRNVQLVMARIIAELIDKARLHDISKYSPEEADLFAKVTPKLSKSEYGSTAYKKNLAKIKPAIEHHYSMNGHHPEHWKQGVKDMTLIELMEMLADWIAASTRNPNGNIFVSIEKNQERFGYSDELKKILKQTACLLDNLTKKMERQGEQ